MNAQWKATADALNIPLEDLLTAVSYETAGTLNPMKAGPTTKWGQHRGLIQFGEPQAEQFGVDFSSPQAALDSQLGADGAIVKYMLAHGFRPGEHGFMDFYSTINAGAPGRYNASDAAAGGAPGTVADKVNEQMAGHRAKALSLLGLSEDQMAGLSRPGPTQARADLGIGLIEDGEPEYADNALGRMQRKRDEMRAGLGEKLGMNDKGMSGMGRGLQFLGQRLMQEGF